MRPIRPLLRITLAKDEKFFGPGARQLLSLIESTGSVSLACQEMGMSYSKGWKILDRMEREMERPVIHRRHGGKNGGAAALTELGRELLERYCSYEMECERAASELFDKHFGDF